MQANCKKQFECENFAILSASSFPKKMRQPRKTMPLRELSFYLPLSTVCDKRTTPLPKNPSFAFSRCFLRS